MPVKLDRLSGIGPEQLSRLRHHVVNPHLGIFVLVVRHRQEVTIELGHVKRGFGAKGTRHSSEQRVVIGILLLEYIDELVAGHVNVLMTGVIFYKLQSLHGFLCSSVAGSSDLHCT